MNEETPRDEVPELIPADQPRRRLTCWYCGSEDLTKGLPLSLSAEVGQVGIKFEHGTKVLGVFQPTGTEPLKVTLCNECGTVVRLSVKETEREWR